MSRAESFWRCLSRFPIGRVSGHGQYGLHGDFTLPCSVSFDVPFERGVVRYNEPYQQGVGAFILGIATKGFFFAIFKGVSVNTLATSSICKERFYFPVHLNPGYLPATQHSKVHVNRV